MKLIVKTRVLALMEDSLRDFATREYVLRLGRDRLPDPTTLERLVHQVACKVEKHKPTLHEHVDSWYVIPDSLLPDTEQQQIDRCGAVVVPAHKLY
jgi:hypothetical protein